MDLPLFARVLWRHKGILAVGFILAVLLAFLSIVRVSPSGKMAYRQHQKFVSYVKLLVSQEGFPCRAKAGCRWLLYLPESSAVACSTQLLKSPATCGLLAVLFLLLLRLVRDRMAAAFLACALIAYRAATRKNGHRF